jgi:7-carboxy-7-deazaguanine synthase
MLTVNEVFHSIQGESSYAGLPCVFVRLTACDRRCAWCDTPYAFYEGRKREVGDVLAEVASYGCRLVEVTGGEPLLQPDVYPLMQGLRDAGHDVLVETGGHVSIERVPAGVVRIMDVKCPGSGEAAKMCWSNLARLGSRDEVKFVIGDRADYDYAKTVVARGDWAAKVAAILFSPVHGRLLPAELAAWVLADRLPVRVQLQVHKYIWEPGTRGV